MKPLLIFGAGQVAQVFAADLTAHGYAVHSFVVDEEYSLPMKKAVCGIDRVVSFSNALRMFHPSEYQFVVGMSFKLLSAPRAAKFDAMRLAGYEPLKFVSCRASVDRSARIGKGSFIMDMNTVQPFVKIGENTIVWSGNHIGHHTKIGNHVFIASHAVISGAVEIGDYSFIGVNATIRDGVKIGKRCVIGAGALILKDCADDGVYAPDGTERSRVPSSRIRI